MNKLNYFFKGLIGATISIVAFPFLFVFQVFNIYFEVFRDIGTVIWEHGNEVFESLADRFNFKFTKKENNKEEK